MLAEVFKDSEKIFCYQAVSGKTMSVTILPLMQGTINQDKKYLSKRKMTIKLPKVLEILYSNPQSADLLKDPRP